MMDGSDDVHLEEGKNIQHTPNNIDIDSSTFLKASLPYSKSPRHVGAVGKFRYLTPSDLKNSSSKAPYDFAVVAHRTVQQVPEGFWFWPFNTAERLGFRRLCMVSSPLLEDGEDEHRRIVERLCAQGLSIDIIDGGHSTGDMTSDYLMLLVRASDDVARAYARKFRRKLWVDHGGVCDMAQDFMEHESRPITPAERIEIVQYIVEQRAGLTKDDRWIHDMFPVHDNTMTTSLLETFITACPGTLERHNRAFVDALRHNFGEKVAYYFAFMHFYNTALLPIALLGLAMQILHNSISTVVYMRLLPFWGLGVSVLWSFCFLKTWDRENAGMQFEWNGKLHVKQIEYPNPAFVGRDTVNPLTGEATKHFAAWRRYPIVALVVVFMVFQTAIMLMLVALWVSIYEMLKDTYKDGGGLFSKQWFAILLEGIVFGFFVDVVQWNLVVTNMGRLFTKWENYRTEEAFERALIRKLFVMDFLNYYTWFFSLAFVYVMPTAGDRLTNYFNTLFFHDAPNCCFGPYLKPVGPAGVVCARCPGNSDVAACTPCTGWFTFDVQHVNLSAMFVTPIVVTQLLNILINVVMPLLSKWRQERLRAAADRDAQKRVMEAGSMKILGNLDYDQSAHFGNKDQSRYLEYTPAEIETLNQKAREILFESEQDHYDPYNDFHQLTVQYGFTVMFSILWPLMPLACMLINSLKVRTDGYRLCRTLKRPFPRKANGIGAWRDIFVTFAYVAVVVNILLICMSTGSMEFYTESCIQEYTYELERQGKTLADFVMGPNFICLPLTLRLIVLLVLEHVFLVVAYLIMARIPGIPKQLEAIMHAREHKFKKMLEAHEASLPLADAVASPPPPRRRPPAAATMKSDMSARTSQSPPQPKRASMTKSKSSPPKDKASTVAEFNNLANPDKAALARQWSD
ncbi:Aste57867_20002 [Aphanomyces stellatus]|uniref:Aste57867_20002 protein n=1 Tax=Aphanomyces stellatus TaxID=120398 RepID=A0A485LFH2_9STRA|nr:hypothetical protein As57867_019936 [Aphanomyces stellatus]VFT96699.1 Aste57867_20002 [Aphanomyces stellatus]